MKKTILLLTVVALSMQMFPQLSTIINFEGDETDNFCPDRFNRRNNDSPVLSIVDNPLISSINPSGKVLLMDFTQTHANKVSKCGQMYLNLTEISNAGSTVLPGSEYEWQGGLFELKEEEKLDISAYDRLSLKYLIKGNFKNTDYNVSFNFDSDFKEEGNGSESYVNAPNIIPGAWETPMEDAEDWTEWNTVTLSFEKGRSCNRIAIRLYDIIENNADFYSSFDERLINTFIYIDDVKFFDSSQISVGLKDNTASKLNFTVNQTQLSVLNVEAGSLLSIYDITGKKITEIKAVSDVINYNFHNNGIYLIKLQSKTISLKEKVIIN